jgi:hypothetical protein
MRAVNRALWGTIVKKYRATPEGSKPGRWSARKAALSRREYERRGGTWQNVTPPQKRGA